MLGRIEQDSKRITFFSFLSDWRTGMELAVLRPAVTLTDSTDRRCRVIHLVRLTERTLMILMPGWFEDIFASSGFMPHGHCYFWRPDVLWLNVGSDALIAVSYFSIPLALHTFVRRRKDLAFPGIFLLFGLFIFACGATHVFEIWTVWAPHYFAEGTVKLATGIISATTAIWLWRLLPKALLLPSPAEMADANRLLQAEIEERRRAEQELRSLNAELERRVAERTEELKRSNEDLEQFAYVASHDLQEPLRMVSTSVGMVESRYGERLDDKGRRYLRYAVDGTTRMKRLMDDLLVYSRAGTANPRRQCLAAESAVDQAIQNLRSAIEYSRAVITKEPLPQVHADATQLVQVFQNMLSNAIKYGAADAPPRIHVWGRKADGDATFYVRDNGIGIFPEHHRSIFEAFRRLHPYDEYPGSGMGLAICERLVRRHGGHIGVESIPGRGATFWFSIPDKA